ncbi:outer membrane beta-barrel family protein [Crocinitomix catalasitica]|uniref:outer membrane beta-barrel family protein n=1 Tax=Crocinitomix catalasitica TaxID=184607 RepID=UPI00047F3269|nr:outer membrane beta-barrel family protein [Crocinitomix catalasitica]
MQLPTVLSSTSIGINFEKKQWLLKANYSTSIGNTLNTSIRNTERTGAYRTELELLEESAIQQHNASLGVNYKIDSSSQFALEYQTNIGRYNVDITSSNKVFADQYTTYDADNIGTINLNNRSLIGNYKKRLDSLGSSLFFGAQYSGYILALEEQISEDISIDNISIGNKQRNIVSNNWIHLLSAQIDHQYFISSPLSISSGIRYSNSTNKGDLNMMNQVEDELIFVPNYSSTTAFTEQLFAAYTEFNLKAGSFDFRAGLRFERTDADGLTTQKDQTSLSRTYNWFIPSVLISKQMNQYIGVNLSYNINTGRPSYNDLDPKVFYVDSLTSKQGNPLLLPQLDHSVKLAINLGQLQLDATYYRSVNAFKNITKEGLGGVNSVVLYRENVDADRFYMSATIPFQKKFFTAYFNYAINWDKIIGEYGDFSSIDLKPNHYFYLYTQIKVKRIVNIEFIGNYFSGRFDGIYEDFNSYSLSIGLSRTFLKDQLKCSILANDIFFSERNAGTYYIGAYSVSYLDKSYSQYMRFSINFSFGKLKEQNYQSVDVGSDEKRRIK